MRDSLIFSIDVTTFKEAATSKGFEQLWLTV